MYKIFYIAIIFDLQAELVALNVLSSKGSTKNISTQILDYLWHRLMV